MQTLAPRALSPSPAALVDALNGAFGSHSGQRAAHAKGVCASGSFTIDPGAAAFAASPFFARASASALLRFSVGGGNPRISDKSRSVRGMALRLSAGGENWDLVMVSEPVFFAATPASFVSYLEARVADDATGKPDPARVAAHNRRYPDGKLQPALLASHPAPASYGSTAYFSNNAFVFHNSAGQDRHARLVAEPVLGTRLLGEAEESALPEHFLEGELRQRLRLGPVAFHLYAQLPAAGDALTDPSQPWRGAGRVRLGLLRIEALAEPTACEGVVFSPVNLPGAVGLSADPILAARHAAYSVSLARRRAARGAP